MLMELLSKAATVAMLIWVVFSMLAMGTGLTLARITERLRNVRLVLLALLANFVLMPIGAEALAKVLRLDEPVEVGLLLLGCAAGGPFLPTFAERAKGDLAFAVSTMVLLMVVTVGYLPIVLPLLFPGEENPVSRRRVFLRTHPSDCQLTRLQFWPPQNMPPKAQPCTRSVSPFSAMVEL
jgi:BASS family bile acid:Na+ symporter